MLILAALTFMLAAAPLFAGAAAERTPHLAGNVLSRPFPAPDFTLTNQDGRSFRLSDERGKVVVLTFIYTHCTDTCPFLTLKAKEAIRELAADSRRVDFVAVTTDPARDTRQVIAAYSKAAGLDRSWRFLTGPLAAVKAVWGAYGVGVAVKESRDDESSAGPREEETVSTAGLSQEEVSLAGRIAARFGGGYEISHSTPFWLIDAKGFVQVSLGEDAAPADIAADVRILLGGE